MKVANAITEVATEEQEEIYWDVEVEP